MKSGVYCSNFTCLMPIIFLINQQQQYINEQGINIVICNTFGGEMFCYRHHHPSSNPRFLVHLEAAQVLRNHFYGGRGVIYIKYYN